MRKLLLLALGYAAYRWLSSPAEDEATSRPAAPAPRDRTGDLSRATSSFAGGARDRTPEQQGEDGEVTYRVVEHDGGWAYKVGDVFSETFGSHDDALKAAQAAARAQQLAGDPEPIEYQDEDGNWRQEDTDGQDRPKTDVQDTQPQRG